MHHEILHQATEVAQAVFPYGLGILAVGYIYGWLSPFLSKETKFRVVNSATRLQGLIQFTDTARTDTNGKLSLKRELLDKVDRANLFILNITRGAFLHK